MRQAQKPRDGLTIQAELARDAPLRPAVAAESADGLLHTHLESVHGLTAKTAFAAAANYLSGWLVCPTRDSWVENLVVRTAALDVPRRCVHLGYCEADTCELFCAADDLGARFLARTSASRLTEDGITTTEAEMEEVEVAVLHRLEVQDPNGDLSDAVLEIKYRRMLALPPVAKAKGCGPRSRPYSMRSEK